MKTRFQLREQFWTSGIGLRLYSEVYMIKPSILPFHFQIYALENRWNRCIKRSAERHYHLTFMDADTRIKNTNASMGLINTKFRIVL